MCFMIFLSSAVSLIVLATAHQREIGENESSHSLSNIFKESCDCKYIFYDIQNYLIFKKEAKESFVLSHLGS